MKNAIYLFYGRGSEYVLNFIYREMILRGYQCVEIDILKENDSKRKIHDLIGKKVVFVNSWHLLLDENNFRIYYPYKDSFYGVLEIIRMLKPVKSIYVPHDLTQPLINKEELFINLFDLFISPCEPFTTLYSQYCETVECGWAKYLSDKTNNMSLSGKAIWFLSDFILHYKMGVEKSFNFAYPILKQGVSIKFPTWTGSKEFEAYYEKNGVKVFSSKTNTIDLIKGHEIIITNGISSINGESYFLGKQTFNITEGDYYSRVMDQLKVLFPDIIFLDKVTDFNLKKIKPGKNPPILKPFNLNKAIKLITN